MTEYRIDCNATTFDDHMTVRRDGDDVYIRAYKGECLVTSVFADSDSARTFARGILALADEIDGGEAPADARPKVGDRLRVTESYVWACPGQAGDIITVVETRYDRPDGPDFVRFADHAGWKWGIPLTAVEPVSEEPLADWERDLIESAPKPAPIKVGDRVEIVRGEYDDSNGLFGVVDEVDSTNIPYRIVDSFGDCIAWAREVRRVYEPTANDSAPASSFAAHVDEAKRLLAGTDHTGSDVITLARELADRS